MQSRQLAREIARRTFFGCPATLGRQFSSSCRRAQILAQATLEASSSKSPTLDPTIPSHSSEPSISITQIGHPPAPPQRPPAPPLFPPGAFDTLQRAYDASWARLSETEKAYLTTIRQEVTRATKTQHLEHILYTHIDSAPTDAPVRLAWQLLVLVLAQRGGVSFLPRLIQHPGFAPRAREDGLGAAAFVGLLAGHFDIFIPRVRANGAGAEAARKELHDWVHRTLKQAVSVGVDCGGPVRRMVIDCMTAAGIGVTRDIYVLLVAPTVTEQGPTDSSGFVQRIMRLRQHMSLHEVLPQVESQLQLMIGTPISREALHGALLGRDIYTISDIQAVAEKIGVEQVTARSWAQAIRNALYVSGVDAAMTLFRHVYSMDESQQAYVPDGCAQMIISKLIKGEQLSKVSHRELEMALYVLKKQSTSARPATRPSDHHDLQLLPLVMALMFHSTYPNRDLHVRAIIEYLQENNIPLDRVQPEYGELIAKIFLSATHEEAANHIIAASPTLSNDEARTHIGRLINFRYKGAPILPFEVFERICAQRTADGQPTDIGILASYTRSIGRGAALIKFDHAARNMYSKVPLASNESYGHWLRINILEAARKAETFVMAFVESLTAENKLILLTAILNMYDGLGRREGIVRVRHKILEAMPPGGERVAQLTLVQSTISPADLNHIWSLITENAGATPIHDTVIAKYVQQLLRLKMGGFAVDIAVRYVKDDPRSTASRLAAAALMTFPSQKEDRQRILDKFPRTLKDPRTKERIGQARRHRLNIGKEASYEELDA
ncbi:hypothetical protein BKA62DRAFT_292967 [Auriculariales sp. MPI-PUGE-AT-0066]|nr:hypothetical protein BKA62DRAFT_292967 [Auriculariales sp. MPI-PUGE-AT-0066]